MRIIILIFVSLIAGCYSIPEHKQEKKLERKIIDVYDSQGKAKEHIVIENSYITIYDQDWKTKGYGRVRESQ